jgi:hypothetical protein
MSSALATTIGIALYVAVLLPVAAAAVMSNISSRIIGVYAVFLMGLAGYHTGIFQRGSLTPTDMIVRSATSTDEAQCKKVVELMRESGLEVDRSDPATPRIIGTGADQIPPEVRDILLACSAAANPVPGPPALAAPGA